MTAVLEFTIFNFGIGANYTNLQKIIGSEGLGKSGIFYHSCSEMISNE